MTQKQRYVGENPLFLENPDLHRMAILVGLKNEKASTLLEDVVHASLLNPEIEVNAELL